MRGDGNDAASQVCCCSNIVNNRCCCVQRRQDKSQSQVSFVGLLVLCWQLCVAPAILGVFLGGDFFRHSHLVIYTTQTTKAFGLSLARHFLERSWSSLRSKWDPTTWFTYRFVLGRGCSVLTVSQKVQWDSFREASSKAKQDPDVGTSRKDLFIVCTAVEVDFT